MTTQTTNKFAKAKVSTKPVAKKDDKVIVTVTDAMHLEALKAYENGKKLEAEGKAAKEAAAGILKEMGQAKVIDNFEKTSRKLESFIITDGKISVLFGVKDAYKRSNLDEDRIEYMKKTYGDDIIDMSTTYKFNTELVEKWGQEISEAIDASKKLPRDVKDNLIECDNKPCIKKGTIDILADIAKRAKTTIAQLYADICPTQYIK